VKGHFGNSVFRGSGTREDSVLGSRVLDSRYPKVRNHMGRQIEGRLIAIDPIGDIVSEFGVCGDQRTRSLTSGLAKSRSPKLRKGEKVPIEASLLLNVSGFGISAVVKTRGRDSLFQNSRSRET
jgi:hypothetical protein